MNGKATLLIALEAALSACQSGPHTVDDILRGRPDGQRVRVQGWLGPCQPYDCRLGRSSDGKGSTLVIGKSAEFDRSIGQVRGQQIVVEGTVDASCISFHNDPPNPNKARRSICIDRIGADLIDPRLIRDHDAATETN